MGRPLRALLCMLATLLWLPAGSARATTSFDLIWRDTGTSTYLSPLGPAILDVVLRADSAGVLAYGISFEFDKTGIDFLDVISADERLSVNLPGSGNKFVPIAAGVTIQESTPTVDGLIAGFDHVTVDPQHNPGAVSTTVTLGTIVFSTNYGYALIDVVIQDNGIDGVIDSNSMNISSSVSLGQAYISFPEPSSTVLLVGGMLALFVFGRRRRT